MQTPEMIRQNSVVMEHLQSMAMCMEGKEKRTYVNAALEAISNPAKNGALMDKLYKECSAMDIEIKNEYIPKSKGDITIYKYHTQIVKMMQILNEVNAARNLENLELLNKLYNILLRSRADFTFGFNGNIFIIMATYKVLVLNLHELINLCIIDTTAAYRKAANARVDVRNSNFASRNTKQFIKMYENGDWNKLVKTYAKAGKSTIMESYLEDHPEYDTVEEGFGETLAIAGGAAMIAFAPGLAAIIGIPIALLLIIRAAFRYYWISRDNLRNNMREWIDIMRADLRSNDGDNLAARKELLDAFEDSADRLDYSITRVETKAVHDIEASNKNDYNTREFSNVSGLEFEF